MTESEKKAWAQGLIAVLDEPRPGQVYRHYKGGLYSIVSVSIMEDTQEVMVTYASNKLGGHTTRTLANFNEPVWNDFETLPRFRREPD